ncbi:hypothetical protein BKH43_03545 [Helicobacter sp. 13S00401-1]|uniref:hypothetical protein n=1 Tax=Helicobacter sp. 13S00401-1 TaxID=1905758 RepID=UPI000BA4F30B|nr:hypothetical protein [Helicobacter sp. 13S00401-1]PAF50941.1 hypothetical protein BKH43_03545 [Helicobacter sp. 13S00401-1]
MNQVSKQTYKKVTKIMLATTLIASFSSVALAATNHKRSHHNTRAIASKNANSNDINGVKFLLGAGVGTGLSANASSNSFTILAPNAGLDARLKLGTGIFTTTRSSTLGLQATLGVGANSIGAVSNLNPQYSVNLDFIQAFKVGATGYVKLGYIIGGGLTIKTRDSGSNGSGNFANGNGDVLGGATQAKRVQSLESSLASANNTKGVAQVGFDTANNALTRIVNNLTSAQSDQNAAASNLSTTSTQYNSAKATLDNAQSQYNAALQKYNEAISNTSGLNAKVPDLQQQLISAQTSVTQAKAYLDTTSQKFQKVYAAYNTAMNNARTAQAATQQPGACAPHYVMGMTVNGCDGTNVAGRNNIAAQAALPAIQNAYREASSALDGAQNTYNNAVANRQKIQNELTAAATGIDPSVTSSLTEATSKLTQAQSAFVPISTNHTLAELKKQNADNSVAALSAQKTEAQKKVDDAKAALDQANANYENLNSEYQKAQEALSAAIAAASQKSKEEQAAEDAAKKANSSPIILPTAKAGLIAFFGKHQAVSLEYQYYFRNTNQGLASSDITLNYVYYFGGN